MATNTNPNMDTISRIYNMYAEEVKRYFVSLLSNKKGQFDL